MTTYVEKYVDVIREIIVYYTSRFQSECLHAKQSCETSTVSEQFARACTRFGT